MPIICKMEILDDESDGLICYLCQEKVQYRERYIHWGVQFEREFVQCGFHRAPTKIRVGLTVLNSYGFADTFSLTKDGELHYKINKMERGTILNPATPSWLSTTQVISLYENPSIELVTKLIDENLHSNAYWESK